MEIEKSMGTHLMSSNLDGEGSFISTIADGQHSDMLLFECPECQALKVDNEKLKRKLGDAFDCIDKMCKRLITDKEAYNRYVALENSGEYTQIKKSAMKDYDNEIAMLKSQVEFADEKLSSLHTFNLLEKSVGKTEVKVLAKANFPKELEKFAIKELTARLQSPCNLNEVS